jgi:uncharacterized FlgJ-related protein
MNYLCDIDAYSDEEIRKTIEDFESSNEPKSEFMQSMMKLFKLTQDNIDAQQKFLISQKFLWYRLSENTGLKL